MSRVDANPEPARIREMFDGIAGSYDLLTDYVIFASWVLYALAIASVFVFRRRMP